jgi:hypothetical protein
MKTTLTPTSKKQEAGMRVVFMENQCDALTAADAARTVLEGSVHFHKRRFLKAYEQDHRSGAEVLNGQVANLEAQLTRLRTLIREAVAQDCTLAIEGVLDIRLVPKESH